MAHIEIPALYRLDVGGSTWGWHKMTDLIEAANNLLDRSPLDRIGDSEKDAFCQTKPDYMLEVCTQEMFQRFGHLNKRERFILSDGHDIYEFDDPAERTRVRDLFVPAQWGMDVIAEIKRLIAEESRVTIPNPTWHVILSIKCSELYKKIFRHLHESGNKPITGAQLSSSVFARIQVANQILKYAGINYAIRPADGKRLGKRSWTETMYRLFPTQR